MSLKDRGKAEPPGRGPYRDGGMHPLQPVHADHYAAGGTHCLVLVELGQVSPARP